MVQRDRGIIDDHSSQMTLAKIAGPDYDARIQRAQHLGASHPFAAEVMNFYQQLAHFQKRLYALLAQPGAQHPTPASAAHFRSHLDLALLLQHFPELLSLLQTAGPPPVAEAARQLSLQGPAAWIAFLTEYWTAAGNVNHLGPHTSHHNHDPQDPAAEALTAFILRVFLEPYAEFLAANRAAPPAVTTHSVCPICNSAPSLGVLRIEGDGGKRHLLCSFCLHEWEFRRILCPTCGEEAENKLPVYIAEQFPHIRVEACDTCRYYIRTIDLTKDGHANPVVDDLAALPLTLWATEHNYSRLHTNLLST
jgi:formate dehydrogenase maturation protein FdhE